MLSAEFSSATSFISLCLFCSLPFVLLDGNSAEDVVVDGSIQVKRSMCFNAFVDNRIYLLEMFSWYIHTTKTWTYLSPNEQREIWLKQYLYDAASSVGFYQHQNRSIHKNMNLLISIQCSIALCYCSMILLFVVFYWCYKVLPLFTTNITVIDILHLITTPTQHVFIVAVLLVAFLKSPITNLWPIRNYTIISTNK